MNTTREAFEAWAQGCGWDISKIGSGEGWDGTYTNTAVRFMWEAWQAACAAERKESAMTNEEIHKIALAHGFRDRPQGDGTTDLNAYVYAFARAMFEAGRSAAPAGWRLVPTTPHGDMLRSVGKWADAMAYETYTAMLAAAPEAKQ